MKRLQLTRKKKIGLIGAALIATVAVLSAQWILALTPPSPTVRISGLFFLIAYDGNSENGFLGSSHQMSPGAAITVLGGEQFTERLTLYSTAFKDTHSVHGIGWQDYTAGFNFVSIQPSPVFAIAPSSATNITLILQAPMKDFSGSLDLIITVQ